MKSQLIEILKASSPMESERLVFPSEEASYTLCDLLDGISQFHQLLADHQIEPGDTVTMVGKNTSEMVIGLLGGLSAGVNIMPLNPDLKSDEVLVLLSHATPKLLITDATEIQYQNLSLKIARPTDYLNFKPDKSKLVDIPGAILIYTSGTTGNPKGVLLQLHQLLYNLSETQKVTQHNAGHVAACFLPLFHLFGIASDLLMNLIYGGKVVVTPPFEISTLPLITSAINEHKVNVFSAVPLMFDLFVKLKAQINEEQLFFCISGGGPLREEVKEAFDQTFKTQILPAYGVTECSCFCLCSPPNDIYPKSVGYPVAMDVMIVDHNGIQVRDGEMGELIIHGPSVIDSGYYRDDRSCYFEIGPKKWFRTGDVAHQDTEGRFYISGRLKSMIIKGGSKVYLEDVDSFLLNMEGIQDVASIKLESGVTQEVEGFASFVVLDSTSSVALSEKMIRTAIRQAIGDKKVPDKIIMVDALKRTPTGKVILNKLENLVI